MPRVKLTEQNVRDIKTRIANGEKQKPIAKDYGISQWYISQIKNGYTWKHVNIGIDLTQHQNFWSVASPGLSQLVINWYKDGYYQEQVGEMISQYIKTLEPKSRPKSICTSQEYIHYLMKKNKIKTRRGFRKPSKEKLKLAKQLKLKGLTNKQIAVKLNVSVITVWRYLKVYGKKQVQS